MKDLQDRSTACQMMELFMKELNIDISGLNVVHVAGSKGKGSTCFYVESALRRYGYTTGIVCIRFNTRTIHFSTYPVFM